MNWWITDGLSVQRNIIQQKGNEVLTHGVSQVDIANVTLNEWRQSQKTTNFVIPFMWNALAMQICRGRNYISDCQLWEGGNGELLYMGMGCFRGGMKIF